MSICINMQLKAFLTALTYVPGGDTPPSVLRPALSFGWQRSHVAQTGKGVVNQSTFHEVFSSEC